MAKTREEQSTLRLLSLDGGGIHGISELIILERIMHLIKRENNLTSDPLPADYFDMICGTGTGGLIGLLLGRLRLSATEALQQYRRLAESVFSTKKSWFSSSKFEASHLEKAIKDVINWKLGTSDGEEKIFWSTNDAQNCKTFVFAVAAKHVGAPRLFRTYPGRFEEGYNCKIWEAARATTAAPTFFDTIKIGNIPGLEEEFVGAALGYNNPSRVLIQEAAREFGENREVGCVVSIGAGIQRVMALSPGPRVLPTQFIQVLTDMATNSESVAEKMAERFKPLPSIYYRLNVTEGLEDIWLQDWEKLTDVTNRTEEYLNMREGGPQIENIAKALTKNPISKHRIRTLRN